LRIRIQVTAEGKKTKGKVNCPASVDDFKAAFPELWGVQISSKQKKTEGSGAQGRRFEITQH